MYSCIKKIKETGSWRNPDLYITFSFISYFSVIIVFLVAPFFIELFHGGVKVAQILILLFLGGGALFSGVGNWLGFSSEAYPAYSDQTAEEILKQLEDRIQERRHQLNALNEHKIEMQK